MINRILFISALLFLVSFGCKNKKNSSKTTKDNVTLIKDNLYKNSLNGELYFSYKIPQRILKDGEDVGASKMVFDSTVILNNNLVVIKNIVDIDSYSKIEGTSNFSDKHYFYNMRDFNIKPKFEAVKKNN